MADSAVAVADSAAMSSASVLAVADSAPSGRDYASEIQALLDLSAQKQRAAEEIDTDAAVSTAEARLSLAAEQALQRGADAAELASAKIAEQQDRFKTGLQADGVQWDAEMVEASGSSRAPAAAACNKYSMQMAHRRKLQEHERLAK